MTIVDLPQIRGRGQGHSHVEVFVRAFANVLDLAGSANRRNLAALQRRRDSDALAADLDRVAGDYRSVLGAIANSENEDVRRAIEAVPRPSAMHDFWEALRQVLDEMQQVQQVQRRDILKQQTQQRSSSARLAKTLKAWHTTTGEGATADRDIARHEHA